MSAQGLNQIVQDKLVFYIDSKNTKCYNGTGIIVNDLCKNSNGVMNGVDFTNGFFIFDSSDYIGDITQKINIQANTPFSVSCVFKTNSSTCGLVGNWNAFITGGWRLLLDNGGKLRFYLLNNNGGIGIAIQSVDSFNNSNVYYCTATYNGNSSSSGLKLYVNGVLITFTSILNFAPGALTNSGIIIGAFQSNTTTINSTINGSISQVMLYNKELSLSEVMQNFNVHKSRYM